MDQTEKKGFAFILLFFSPILGLFYALSNLTTRTKLAFFTIFGAIYGATINYIEGNDSWTYAQNLKKYYDISFTEFIEGCYKIITFDPPSGSPTDLYVYFLNAIAGGIFQSPILLFTIVGAIYGLLYGSAMLKIVQIRKGQKITFLIFALVTLFVTYKGFEHMQTIRSWTGMYFLFNGVLGYYQTKKRKYLLMIVFAFFFHLMYVFISIPALILILVKKVPRYLLIGVYVLSFLMNVNSLNVVNLASNNQLAKNKLNSYYRITDKGEEIDPIALKKETSKAVWYADLGKGMAVNVGTTFFIAFLILGGFYRKRIMTNVEYGLFSTGILTATLANFLSFAYALYGRTMSNASIYILAVMVLIALRGKFNLSQNVFWKNALLYLGLLIFIPKMFYFFSDFMYRTSFLVIAFPFLNFFSEDFAFSIRDFINQLL